MIKISVFGFLENFEIIINSIFSEKLFNNFFYKWQINIASDFLNIWFSIAQFYCFNSIMMLENNLGKRAIDKTEVLQMSYGVKMMSSNFKKYISELKNMLPINQNTDDIIFCNKNYIQMFLLLRSKRWY